MSQEFLSFKKQDDNEFNANEFNSNKLNTNEFNEFNDTQLLDLINKVLELYKKNNLEELELKVKDFEIKISSKSEFNLDLLKLINIQSNLASLANLSNLGNFANVTNESQTITNIKTQINNKNTENNENTEDLTKYSKLIKAPLSGNFYINVAGSELVNINKNVKKGDVVCVIEAMKVMNEVNSEFDGVVKKIIPNNGDFVKEGDILIILE